MIVLNVGVVEKASRRNKPLRRALMAWLRITEAADWDNIADLHTTFPSADGVAIQCPRGRIVVATVFNIMGNRYRLITIVHFATRTVIIREVLSHEEYDREKWKVRICQ